MNTYGILLYKSQNAEFEINSNYGHAPTSPPTDKRLLNVIQQHFAFTQIRMTENFIAYRVKKFCKGLLHGRLVTAKTAVQQPPTSYIFI
jgi:hypothetical protein